MLVAYQFRNKSLAHGSIQSRRAAKKEREDIDLPKANMAGYRNNTQGECKKAHSRLSHHQELALVEVICGIPGLRQQKKLRRKLQRHHNAYG